MCSKDLYHIDSHNLHLVYVVGSVVRLLNFHHLSSKIIGQEVSIDDRL